MSITEKTAVVVIFRKWRNTGEIIALFPQLAWNRSGSLCASYERIGQHGGASPLLTEAHTVPAKPSEYESLARELERIGYVLTIRQRRSAADDRKRIQSAAS